MACSLGAADFGILQSALALATILAATTALGLDPLIRDRLKQHPLETAMTLGTGMALRCGAGIIAYLVMVVVTLSTETMGRPVWMVATLLVLTQAPLLIGLRFEDPAHQPRAVFARNVALILSTLIVVMLVWISADPVWFAAAIVLEQPFAGLLLLFSHDRVAPEEESFHWDWAPAKDWLKRCWKPLSGVLLTLALLPISQLVLIWRSTPAAAGHFGIAAVLFEFGAFCAAVILLGRMTHSRTTPDQLPLHDESAVAEDFSGAASMGWILAAAAAGLSVLLAFTAFRSATLSAALTGGLLSLGLVPLSLGLVRDEYWRRAGCADRTLHARMIAVGINLVLAFALAPLAGAAGVAGAALVSLIVGEVIMTLFHGNAPKLAHFQVPALLFVGRRRNEKSPAPTPLRTGAASADAVPSEATPFIGTLLRPTLSPHHNSAGAAVKNP